MNGYERYMGMVYGDKIDVVPRIPILMHFAAKYLHVSYADFARDPEVMVRANCKLVEDFGFEQLDIMSDPWREATGFGVEIEFQEETTPKCLSRPIDHEKDLSLLRKPNYRTSQRMANAVRAIQAYKKYGWKKYSITGWVEGPAAEAADLREVQQFMMDLLEDTAFSCELMDICVDAAIEYAYGQIDAGADTIGMGDAVASLISADLYDEYVMPREKRIIDAVHEAGGLVRLHICGDTTHLLPHMAKLGCDIVDLDWMVDMEQARRVLGPKVTLTGNLDPVNAIMTGTPESIRRGFEEIYERVGRPFFVNAGCEIPRDTPLENLEALCKPIPA